MKLTEIFESDDKDRFDRTHEIRQWIQKMGTVSNAKIDLGATKADDSIYTDTDVDLGFKGFKGKIPYKFSRTGHFTAGPNPNLTSFENFPTISTSVDISNTGIQSLVGIEKVVRETSGLYIQYTTINEGGIGLLLIDKIRFIEFNTVENKQNKAFDIIFNYIKKGSPKNHLFDCQAELIENGLEEYAKL